MDSRARGGDDRAVLEMWEELDMTTVARDSGLDQKLLQLLEQQEIRYEIIDGALVVNPPPGFSHEDWLMETAVQLRIVSPPDIAVLGSGFKYFYAALSEGNTVNHTMADITVVRRSDVEERGTVRPPLLVVECTARRPGAPISVASARSTRAPAWRRTSCCTRSS